MVGAGACLAFIAFNLDGDGQQDAQAAVAEHQDAAPQDDGPLAPFFITGWSLTYGTDVAAVLDLDMVDVATPDDDGAAWAGARAAVAGGTPVILHGDIYHLWYKPRIYFAAHQYVLVGYDEDEGYALVVERSYAEPLKVPLADLALSRHAPGGTPLRVNAWTYLRSGRTRPPAQLPAALLGALHATARRMVDGTLGGAPGHLPAEVLAPYRAAQAAGLLWVGLPGLRRFRAALGTWRQRYTPAALAPRLREFALLITKHGSGGGLFRNTLTAYLRELVAMVGPAWVCPADVRRAQTTAEAWDALAAAFDAIASGSGAAPWAQADACLRTIDATETALFTDLATRLAPFASPPRPAHL
jgi:hypothetical protein